MAHLLVNKQYFEESSKVWLRSKTFYFWHNHDFANFVYADGPIQRFMLGSVTRIEVNDEIISEQAEQLACVPALRSLRVQMRVFHMEFAVPGKMPWLDDYTDAELASIPHVSALLSIRGLRRIKLMWHSFSFDFPKPEHRVKWEAFKARVEALIHDFVTQPREETETGYKSLHSRRLWRKRRRWAWSNGPTYRRLRRQ
ncbi:hypothetical protein M409DRAFT_20109 [Zasmidium cellare ATCC 36951]|uniref:Uncharacterized protein n=1 Tax=Zasmidium cellare ATCC 36951 TaxID=1080233 RepID=A0A6A6CSL4_ZASCE|nr:uncharacterized protein M409DRAFT_20109 [Zasmidium cellare ATCC 36951]KAF2169693.1 hypothetical protein M409DRAFT_20109 [Zasmidium cellare ATCC 36951]